MDPFLVDLKTPLPINNGNAVKIKRQRKRKRVIIHNFPQNDEEKFKKNLPKLRLIKTSFRTISYFV